MLLVEYYLSALIMCAVSGVAVHLSYDKKREGSIRLASGILIFFLLLSPLPTALRALTKLDTDELFDTPALDGVSDNTELADVAREAYCEGIKRLLSEQFGIEASACEVFAYGFDFETMSATRVKIILRGKGVFADYRRIESYITEQGLGECEVELLIG